MSDNDTLKSTENQSIYDAADFEDELEALCETVSELIDDIEGFCSLHHQPLPAWIEPLNADLKILNHLLEEGEQDEQDEWIDEHLDNHPEDVIHE